MPFRLTNASSTRDTSSAIYDAIYFDSEAAARSITFGSFDFMPHSSMLSLVSNPSATGWIWHSAIYTSMSATLVFSVSRTRLTQPSWIRHHLPLPS